MRSVIDSKVNPILPNNSAVPGLFPYIQLASTVTLVYCPNLMHSQLLSCTQVSQSTLLMPWDTRLSQRNLLSEG